jgi:glycosyltransferase involved in cell wall biosynthesis
MKILHIIDDLGVGGGQSLLVSLTAQQKKMGHDVTVLQLIESQDRTISDKIKAAGVRVLSLSSNGSVYNPLLICKIIPYLRKYDVAHVHLFPALYWAGFAKLLSFSKTPLIFTEHSTANRRRSKPLLHAVDRFVYSNLYKEVIACADLALVKLKESYPTIKASSIPNGVDIEKYANAVPYTKHELCGITEDQFITTMVARFNYPKRQDTLVRAIAKLPSKFHAVFVGGNASDEKLQEIQALAKELKVSERVHFLYVRPDVPEILKTSDAILMSSEYEGLSLSSIEGMASGHPFIATNVNGLREVVDGYGILYELGDENQLAHVLQKLSEDNSYYNQIVDKCTKRAAQFDIYKVAEQYIQAYKKYTR